MFELNLVIYHRVKLQRHRRYKFCERKQIQLFELLPLKPLDDFLKCFTYLRNQRRIWRLKLWFKICFYWTVTEMSFQLGKKGFIETVRWQLRWDRNSSCFVVLIVLGKCFCISNISAFVSCCFEVKKWWRCFSRGLFVLLFLFFQASNEEVKGPGMSMKLLQQHQGVLMEKKTPSRSVALRKLCLVKCDSVNLSVSFCVPLSPSTGNRNCMQKIQQITAP